MKDFIEIRKIIREVFELNERGTAKGFFQNLDLERDPDKSRDKEAGDKDSEKKKQSVESHPLNSPLLDEKKVETLFNEVMKIVKSNFKGKDIEVFNKELTELNNKIKDLSKIIRKEIGVGRKVPKDSETKFLEFLRDAIKSLSINAPNSLKNKTVKDWYLTELVKKKFSI